MRRCSLYSLSYGDRCAVPEAAQGCWQTVISGLDGVLDELQTLVDEDTWVVGDRAGDGSVCFRLGYVGGVFGVGDCCCSDLLLDGVQPGLGGRVVTQQWHEHVHHLDAALQVCSHLPEHHRAECGELAVAGGE